MLTVLLLSRWGLRVCWVMGLCLVVAACSSPQQTARVVQIGDNPAGIAQQTAQIVYVTPTRNPTTIPTHIPMTPTPTLTVTPVPPTATNTPDADTQQAMCDAVLTQLYETAGDLCLGQPSGHFCNGGVAPSVQPTGPISSAMALPGALVEVARVDSVHTSPLMTNNSGGILWMHLLDDDNKMNALLIGDVRLRNATPPNAGFPKWHSVVLQTLDNAGEQCPSAPVSSFLVQSPYGEATSIVINGVSIDLNGSLIAQTHGLETFFIVIEGRARVIALGLAQNLFAGQQTSVVYQNGDFTFPANVPGDPAPLTFDLIDGLPVPLLDRPVLLPQPGYAVTNGRINMRTEASVNSQLLYQVPANEVLSILGENSERTWSHIRLGNGETGWMRSDLLTRYVGEIQQTYDATPMPPQRYGELASAATVNVSQGGNLRTAPDTAFSIITTLPKDTRVELLARSPYSPWVKVNANGQVGWMALITLETRSAIGFLPFDYDVPLPPRATSTPVFEFGGGHAYPNPNGGS